VFVKFLAAIGMKEKSATKRIPSLIFESTKSVQSAFLAAYFEGDGGVDGAAVTAISKSPMLISDISYLLYCFGIRGRISVRKKMIPGKQKADYHLLSLSGQSNLSRFTAHINFVSARKRELLAGLAREENTNVDVIPGLVPLFAEVNALLGRALRGLHNWSPLRRGVFNPSQRELRRVIADIRNVVKEVESKRRLFDVLARLPNIADIIATAAQSKTINAALWKELGSSWATIQRGMVPGAVNALRALRCAGIAMPEMAELKSAVSEGFAFLAEPMKHHNPSLRSALHARPEANTSYTMLAEAAAFITARYESLYAHIPRVEEILARLERLAEANLAWDEIVIIEPFKNEKERYVYDLTVDNEVFLAGYGGMFVHNSYMTKLEILRSLMFGTDVIVIDPEREYEYLAEATGGKYFNISLNSEHHINPFELPMTREDEAPADVLRSQIINLVGLFRILFGGLTPEEDAIIDRAITETYALKDITADADFSKIEPPLLSDFELVLAGMQGGESLVQRLFKYTHGTWSGFINQPSNVDINAGFIVFSLRDMEDELKSAAMYIVMHFIWNAIRKELKKRLMVIDEAWWMMKSEDTASFLLGLAKRGRKYYLGLSTITQDVDDFLKSPYGMPILTNSSMQILLKQSPTVVDKLQTIFNLTDEEKYLLLESDVGEGLFFVGLKHVAIKVIASYTEDQIITSDPSQLLSIKKAKEELKSMEK
ncbi:MAG TPA: LAGLIDADG family homing endonuclease, partial [Candidatus Paceibacterota bacterium]